MLSGDAFPGQHTHSITSRGMVEYLVGAVRAPQLLYCLVSTPGQLQGHVHAQPRVAGRTVRLLARDVWART